MVNYVVRSSFYMAPEEVYAVAWCSRRCNPPQASGHIHVSTDRDKEKELNSSLFNLHIVYLEKEYSSSALRIVAKVTHGTSLVSKQQLRIYERMCASSQIKSRTDAHMPRLRTSICMGSRYRYL